MNKEITITINSKKVSVKDNESVFDVIKKSDVSLYTPEHVKELDWINNDNCPLVKIVEVDNVIKSFNMLKTIPVHDKMIINTDSESLKKVLNERIKSLHENQECSLIRIHQEFMSADAESAGYITMEDREQWNYEERISAPSLIHNANKCVRCEACVRTCNDMQGVGAITLDRGDVEVKFSEAKTNVRGEGIIIDEKKCVRCGQCIITCPMGAIERPSYFIKWNHCEMCAFSRPIGAMHENDDTQKVLDAIDNPEKFVVVQFAPAVRSTIGEEFRFEVGAVTTHKLYAALRKAGFNKIWDTNFTADLTIMEEGSELIKRVKEGGVLPQFTSCSPGWIKYVETYHASLLPNLSSAKSPQQMFGSVAKTYAAEKLNIDPRNMVVVSIMPCTAKKFEATREEMNDASKYWNEKGKIKENYQDVDIVLTTRELSKLLKIKKINLAEMPDENADPIIGEYTGAAPIFGRTGGVMEAALRTAYELLTGAPLAKLEFESLGTFDGVKKASVNINGIDVKVAVAHGLANAKIICDSIESKGEFASYHFIEFMCCPGGCIGGGGQIIPSTVPIKKMRAEGLNKDDKDCGLRKSHENEEVKKIYADFLKEPLGHLAHELLHTKYIDRSLKN